MLWATFFVLRLEALTRAARGPGPVRLLDFGCGNGEFVAMCNLHGFDAVGVDRSTARQSNSLVPIHAELDEVINAFTPQTMQRLVERVGYRLIKRPVAYVTAKRSTVVKAEVKNMLGAVLKPTTQLYFQRTAP